MRIGRDAKANHNGHSLFLTASFLAVECFYYVPAPSKGDVGKILIASISLNPQLFIRYYFDILCRCARHSVHG